MADVAGAGCSRAERPQPPIRSTSEGARQVRISDLGRHALTSFVAAAMLAGCGGSQPPIGTPGAMAQSAAQAYAKSFHVLYRFAGGHDGAGPAGALIDVNGTLYGATSSGGGHPECGYGGGCGTVYSMSTAGPEKVLHRFASGSDGWDPFAGLIDASGTLYGTTRYGGGSGCVESFGCGTVYTISPSGKEENSLRLRELCQRESTFCQLDRRQGHVIRYDVAWRCFEQRNGVQPR